MEQEEQPLEREQDQTGPILEGAGRPDLPLPVPSPGEGLRWIFVGNQGLRAGWSVAIFAAMFLLFARAIGYVIVRSHLAGNTNGFTPGTGFFGELVGFLAMLGAASIVALIERRRILDYNLTDPRRLPHFLSGLATGFAALSTLVGALAWGSWLHFGPTALSGSQIFKYAAAWACVFLLVGCVEEGTMRCYLLFTLTRGINFWWAVGINGAICLELIVRAKGNGVWGVYAMALLGLIPCFVLHLKNGRNAGFWQASWVTSTLFCFGHTGNNGENWIGIFAAGLIGFVFCVSVRVTGSAWWAIGCHAAWDWTETYFYGTADSGFTAQGHLLTTTATGNALWSGGTDGPEGSLLVLPLGLIVLMFLLVLYGRKATVAVGAEIPEKLAW